MKIISGGQSGIDQLALKIAKEMGFETGGYCAKGFMTEFGPEEQLLKSYGLIESGTYAERTRRNVKESDITLLFGDLWTPGSKCTINACNDFNKPLYANTYIDLQLAEWMENHQIINVAGNRESKVRPETLRYFELHFRDALLYLKQGYVRTTLF